MRYGWEGRVRVGLVGVGQHSFQRDHSARTVSLSQTALIDCVVSTFGQADPYPISIPTDPRSSKVLTERGKVKNIAYDSEIKEQRGTH